MVRRENYDWWEANVRYDAERAEREEDEKGTVEIDVTTFGGEPKTKTVTLRARDNEAYRRDFPHTDDEDPRYDDLDRWANEGGAVS